MLGYRFSEYIPEEQQEGQSTFDQLMKIFMELLVITSGDVSEALQWMNSLDNQYGITTDEYGMGDFIQDMKDKGYLTEENQPGEFDITAKAERKFRRDALEEIFGKMKKSGQGDHRTTYNGFGDEPSTERRGIRVWRRDGANLYDRLHPQRADQPRYRQLHADRGRPGGKRQ